MRTRAWIGGFGLAAVCGSVIALAACSSNDSNGGGSGGANDAKGGATSSSGGSTSASGGSTSASGGSTSASGGSTSASGGSTSASGGSGTAGMSGFACAGKVADCSVISDFPTTKDMQVWGGTDFGGGITTFNSVTRDDTKTDVLHMTGVGNKYGGFGLWFNSCSDLSQYTGVSFKISGTAGTTNTIDFQAQTNSDYPWQADMGKSMKGGCTSPTPDSPWGDCIAPAKTAIAISTEPKTVTVMWGDITGGKPKAWDATTSPKELVGIQWQFPAATDEYMVDVTVDDVTFIGGSKTCATGSGSGGAGGSSSGGASNGGSSNGGSSNGGSSNGGSSNGGSSNGGSSNGGSSNGGSSSGGAGGASSGGAAGTAGSANGGGNN